MPSVTLLFASVLLTSFAVAPDPLGKQGTFSLRAEVLFALERGPVVVRVILRYQGPGRVEIRQGFTGPNCSINCPAHWSMRPLQIEGFSGITHGRRTMNPGDEWAEIHYLHHTYEDIPSGKVKVHIEWTVRGANKPAERVPGKRRPSLPPVIARPAVILPFDIPKATPARVAKLVQGLEREVNRPRLTDKQIEHIFDVLLHSRHYECIPLTLKLLNRDCLNYPKAKFIPFIYDCARTPAEAHAALVGYVLTPQPVIAENVFSEWRNVRWRSSWAFVCQDLPNRGSLPQRLVWLAVQPKKWTIVELLVEFFRVQRFRMPTAEIRRLCGAPNIWVRILTYATFPERCDRAWVAGLMKDLRRLNNPLPPEQFKRLLRQLDDDKFAVRERAAAELLRSRDAVEPTLRDALKQPLSLELKRRIERILQEIDKQVPDPLRRDTLAYLSWYGIPEAKSVLQTLAKGMPQSRLTKEAAAALRKLRKPSIPP